MAHMTDFQIICALVIILVLIVLVWKVGLKLIKWELEILAKIFSVIWPFILIGVIVAAIWGFVTCIF